MRGAMARTGKRKFADSERDLNTLNESAPKEVNALLTGNLSNGGSKLFPTRSKLETFFGIEMFDSNFKTIRMFDNKFEQTNFPCDYFGYRPVAGVRHKTLSPPVSDRNGTAMHAIKN